MTEEIQKVNFELNPFTSDEIDVKIPKKGKIKPSPEKKSFSNLVKTETIQIFVSSNYIPGKISFKMVEEP
jgi:hypothetical protein